MKKIIFLVANGIMENPLFLREKLEEVRPVAVICADGAAKVLRGLDIFPTVIIGDMDSVDAKTLQACEGGGAALMRYPVRKDKTDTQLALEYAFSLQPEEIWIFGALGGRIDHAFANLSLLVTGNKAGVRVKIREESCEIFVVDKTAVLRGSPGETISLLPLSARVEGINLSGFEYPLTEAVMEVGNPYGISNSLIDSEAVITVRSGYLLVIRYFKEVK